MNFTRNKPAIIAVAVLVVLILLMVATSSSNTVSQSTTVVGAPFVPLQTFFYGISESISGIAEPAETIFTEQQQDMTNELDAYKTQLMDYDELAAENQRLKGLLEYKDSHTNQQLIVAKITGKEPGNWFDVFTINVGSADGIKEQMPVVTADGLVGRVEEVGPNWAKVMAVIDGRSSVPIIMERTRDIGVAGGSIGGNDLSRLLSMKYLPLDSDIVEGDVVLTSGLGGIFPKGLVVGTVVNTTTTDGGINVMIEPGVDFRRLEEVMVIVSTADDSAVVEEDIADPNAQVAPLESATPTDGGEQE